MSLQKLLENQNLNTLESYALFDDILNQVYNDIEISSILTSLKIKNESIDEITGAVNALIHNAKRVNIDHLNLTDTCGTGGDGHHTFNISTLSSIVCASLNIPIMKHGNRSVSSKCGSADILEKTGYNINNINVEEIFNKTGYAFIFAPLFHSGVKNVMNVRQTLKTRTIFNILGPLINPAPIRNQILGVYDATLAEKLTYVLQKIGRENAVVCHGSGLDEIAIHGRTTGFYLSRNEVQPFLVEPSTIFKEALSLSDICSKSIEENIHIFNSVLKGNALKAHLYAVAINVAVALWINHKCISIKDGFELALSHIKSGKVNHYYKSICEASNDTK